MKKQKIEKCKLAMRVVAFVGLLSMLTASATYAQTLNRTTLLFHNDVTSQEIDVFLDVWSGVGVQQLMRLSALNGVVLELPAGVTIADLASDPLVATASADQTVDLQSSGKDIEGRTIKPLGIARLKKEERPWGVLQLYKQEYDPDYYIDFYDAHAIDGLLDDALDDAHKVNIAVFDTGLDNSARRLHGKIKDGINLVDLQADEPMDGNGHGTHVSGTLLGQEFGIVPGARLYPVKILADDATGDVSTLVMALQWAIDNEIDVINMSVGFRDDHPAVREMIRRAYEAGIIMVAAAGNHSNWEDDGGAGEGGAGEGGAGEGGAGEGGAGEGGAGEGGAGGTCDELTASGEGGAGEGGAGEGGAGEGGAGEGGAGEGGAGEGGAGSECGGFDYDVMYPAKYPEVIAVGAIDPYGQTALFSNNGLEIDVFAPGVDIVSSDLADGYGTSDGTSMAAPHVTGAVALMIAVSDYQLTPDQAKSILRKTAYASGVIDLIAALEAVAALY